MAIDSQLKKLDIMPMVKYYMDQLGLHDLFSRFLPHDRCIIPTPTVLGAKKTWPIYAKNNWPGNCAWIAIWWGVQPGRTPPDNWQKEPAGGFGKIAIVFVDLWQSGGVWRPGVWGGWSAFQRHWGVESGSGNHHSSFWNGFVLIGSDRSSRTGFGPMKPVWRCPAGICAFWGVDFRLQAVDRSPFLNRSYNFEENGPHLWSGCVSQPLRDRWGWSFFCRKNIGPGWSLY